MIPSKTMEIMEKYHLTPLEFEGEDATATAIMASERLGVSVGQIAKTLLFKDKFGKYTMIVASGDKKLQNIKIKELIGSRVSMTSSDETLEITGYPVGGVCPYAISNPLVTIYVDDSLKEYDTLYTACGSKNSLVAVNYDILIDIAYGNVCTVT